MGEFDESFSNTLKVQSWSLYGVGIFLVVLRMSVSMSITLNLTLADFSPDTPG